MSFLSPWTIALAAGLTVPPLIALYFLKLKRNVQLVPSTLLWRKAVEDLQVNSPFQRLRASLLFFLQLLAIVLCALALGQPMWQTAAIHHQPVILLIDRSASMAVREADGRTRLEKARDEAKRTVENLAPGARAMVIAFADRATVISSFDSDRRAVQARIDSIEQTQGPSRLGEAVALAEAHAQNMIIGGEQVGTDVAADASIPAARVFLFSDGRIEDQEKIVLEKFEAAGISAHTIGQRDDNVGILAMDARRDYDRPEMLDVVATVGNFGKEPVTVDAVLIVEGRTVDVQTIRLAAAEASGESDQPSGERGSRPVEVVAFDEIEFGGAGIVEVMLRIDDALPTDDRAWAVIAEPRRLKVLLVNGGFSLLPDVLSSFAVDLTVMSGAEYEAANDDLLLDGRRSAFDVVVFDRHSSARLPQGNYFFWGAAPRIEGVAEEGVVTDQIIFNWDETHPVLRHVAVETLIVNRWLRLKLPPEAITLIEGEDSPVLTYLVRGASQFLTCAFSVIVEDRAGDPRWNTQWITTVDFILFVQNALSYLSSEAPIVNVVSVPPGEPISVTLSEATDEVAVLRPDGTSKVVATGGNPTLHYSDTHTLGVYRIQSGKGRTHAAAVNLFNEVESNIAPSTQLTFGQSTVSAGAADVTVNRPAWSMVLGAFLAILLLEWVVYNKRVFV